MTVAAGTATTASGAAGHRQLSRVTGVAGLTTMVLLFVPAIAQSGQEPGFTGTREDILAFFSSMDSPLAAFGGFAFTLGTVALLWFVVGLSSLLAAAEGELPWRSRLAAGSGAVFVAVVLVGSWGAAAFRAEDLDPDVARYAFDQGNLSFANGWVALGSFAVCAGWVIISAGFAPSWWGWWALLSGGGLALSRAAWTTEIWLLPYAGFWLWVAALSVRLLRP